MKFIIWIAYLMVCIGTVASHDIGTTNTSLACTVIAFSLGFVWGLL